MPLGRNVPLWQLHHTELFFSQPSQGQCLGFSSIPHSDSYMFLYMWTFNTFADSHFSNKIIYLTYFLSIHSFDEAHFMPCLNQGFSILEPLTLGPDDSLLWEAVHCINRMFSSVSCRCSLDASKAPQLWQSKISPDIAKSLFWGKTAPSQKYLDWMDNTHIYSMLPRCQVLYNTLGIFWFI